MGFDSIRLRAARCAAVLALGLLAARCGGGGTSTTPSGTKVTLSGVVRDSGTGAPVAGARVEITASASTANVGLAATGDAAGKYALSNVVPGLITLRISAANYLAATTNAAPTADQVLNFSLAFGSFSTGAQAVDVLSGAPLGGVTVTGADVSSNTSDANGMLSIIAATSSTALRSGLVKSSSTFDRQANLHVPGAGVVLDLIPSGFDMVAFDQMLRSTPNAGGGIVRWTTAPGLVIERRTLKFDATSSLIDAVAASEVMTDDDVAGVLSDLLAALPLLTGGTFSAFASVVVQTSAEGQTVQQRNTGVVFFSRQSGLSVGTGNALGLGVWALSGNTVVGGTIGVDRDRDVGDQRAGVRAHELGHALGYQHVNARLSLMNPNIFVLSPNLFDQQATQIAFRRLPGSLTPDKDPLAETLNVTGRSAIWSSPVR